VWVLQWESRKSLQLPKRRQVVFFPVDEIIVVITLASRSLIMFFSCVQIAERNNKEKKAYARMFS
jgi:hypothetical protein